MNKCTCLYVLDMSIISSLLNRGMIVLSCFCIFPCRTEVYLKLYYVTFFLKLKNNSYTIILMVHSLVKGSIGVSSHQRLFQVFKT